MIGTAHRQSLNRTETNLQGTESRMIDCVWPEAQFKLALLFEIRRKIA